MPGEVTFPEARKVSPCLWSVTSPCLRSVTGHRQGLPTGEGRKENKKKVKKRKIFKKCTKIAKSVHIG